MNRQDLVDKLIKSVDPNSVALGNFILMPNEAGYADHYGGVGTGDAAAAKGLLEGAGWTLGADGVYAGPPRAGRSARPAASRPVSR